MKTRTLVLAALFAAALPFAAHGQTDWPNFSRDAGGTRYSPLKRINTRNVAKLKGAWMFDNFERNGKEIPAVAQITKQGLLFILDRFTGNPIYDVVERPVALDNIPPGDDTSPTQPFPVKPHSVTRNSFAPDELANLMPERDKACKDLFLWRAG